MANNVDFLKAMSAYNDVASVKADKFAFPSDEKVEGGNNFAAVLGNFFENAKAVFKKSEDLSSDMIQKKANITDVVTAVSEAELALNTIISLRDKLISSYMDILKMQM
jgi:flagellar hook-basal body complex protein FliE